MYWIEIRCENRTGEFAEYEDIYSDKGCRSSTNSDVADSAEDSVKGVLETLKSLRSIALSSGYKMTKYGWICPRCAEEMEIAKKHNRV